MAESINRIIATPYPNPRGLVYVDGYLWCCFGDDNRIVQMDLQGNVLNDFPSPGANPRGLGYDGEHFWNSDAASVFIFKLDWHGNVVGGFISPFQYPRACVWDIDQMHILEFGSLARSMSYHKDGHLHHIYYLGFTDINGVAIVGNFFYISDQTTTKIYKINRLNVLYDSFTPTATSPRGLTSDGTYLYLAAGDAQKIYVLNNL